VTDKAFKWLWPYAGMMTLVAVLFLVLFARERSAPRSSDNQAAPPPSAPVSAQLETVPREDGSLWVFESATPPGSVSGSVSDASHGVSRAEWARVEEEVRRVLGLEVGDSAIEQVLRFHLGPRGLEIRISFPGFFSTESLPADLIPVMDRIGRVLKTTDRILEFEVFVDERGESSLRAEAWANAFQRANSLLEDWNQKFQIDPQRVRISVRPAVLDSRKGLRGVQISLIVHQAKK
jgi:hypothetical protein